MSSRFRALVGGALALGAVAALAVYLNRTPAPGFMPRAVADEPAAPANKGDHRMFGGTPARNFVNHHDTGLSHEFPKSEDDEKVRALGSRVKWKETLGSRAYGGPIVAGGRVYVGTNNENPRNDRDRGKASEDDPKGPPIDKGIVMCFDEKTGKFLWQMVHDKMESGQVNDWPREGVCSTPVVDGDRVYYTSNRCEVVCLDATGMANGNDGFQAEKYKTPTDGDVLWSYDMYKELKVFPHNMTDCSPLIVGDLIFVVTANGVDENHANIPFPEAPSFIALSKQSGKLVWKSNLPGRNIMHGQWANPTYAVVGGKAQVIFPGGDGWLYGLEPETGKVIWKFDANPKDSKYELGGKGTRSDFIGTPVIYNDKMYIGTGQDPEHFDGVGHFWCIELTKQGDVSPELVVDDKKDPPVTKPNPNSAVVWHFGGDEKRNFVKRDFVFGRTMSSACIVDDVLYIADIAGYLHCLDAKTGTRYWQWDTKAAIWGSAYYVDGKVILANEDGDMYFFKHEKTHEVLDEVDAGSRAGTDAENKAKAGGKDESDARKAGNDARDEAAAAVREKVKTKYLLQKVEVAEAIRSTPIVANGGLYILTEKTLYAVNPK
ncbi:MAG TPA: PQQ-binding-like beta-propeller repeat protein [Gemmataceae bacterium]|nr:PQQ-binding-like beta-propeller repeat protein [Gemmataceae bacterium]